jgi:hypothetical protein
MSQTGLMMTAAAFAFAFLATASEVEPGQSNTLKIVVIEGEGAVNIIQQKTAVAPVIEVRDRNDLPVAGVPVTFTIIGAKTGSFTAGAQTLTVTTNAAGRAIAAGFNPLASGAVQINVTAAVQGQTLAATITQTNVLTAAQAAQAGASAGASSGSGGAAGGGGGGLSPGVIGGVAVAGGLAAVALGREETPKTPSLSISRSPTSAGIRGVTVFTFTATSANIASPTYTWDFGDGGTAVGQTVTHVFATEGT